MACMLARCWLAVASTVVSVVFVPCLAHAQHSKERACEGTLRPWVAVAFGGVQWTQALRDAVMEDLAAGLALKGIDACALGHAGRKPPLAVVELKAGEDERVSVGIEIYDALTEKRVIRELDLHEIAIDARSLALAAAADELLRASWAELAIHDAPKTKLPAPAAVQRTLRQSLDPSRVGARDTIWGVRATLDQHAGGQTWLGADTFITLWLAERVGFELGVGLREGLAVASNHGRIESRGLAASGSALVALLQRGDIIELALAFGAQVASVRMLGSAEPGARAAQGAAVDVQLLGGLVLDVTPIDWLALRAQLGGGAPVRSVEAADDGDVITSTHGPALHAGLGAGLRF